MKLWEINVIAQNNRALLQEVSSEQNDWKTLEDWFAKYEEIVDIQDRAKLDFILPEEFVEAVLTKLGGSLFLSEDGWLRSWRFTDDDKQIPLLGLYKKFGGSVLADVYEYGSVKV